MKVLVLGSTGLVGRAVVNHFKAKPGLEVIAAARRATPDDGVRRIVVDLSDREMCHEVLGRLTDITHVVYAVIQDGGHHAQNPDDYVLGNLNMFRNVVETIERSSPGVEHMSFVHGTAAYPISVNPKLVRLRESDPRPDVRSFYFAQEDYLADGRARRRWAWTIWRPTVICGDGLGASMNCVPALGVFGAIQRAKGQPLQFPGNRGYYLVREAVDSELIARAIDWAATEPRAKYETYNISNGDQFEFGELWNTVAEGLGMEIGPDRPVSVVEEVSRNADVWRDVVRSQGLAASTDPFEVAGESFAFVDRMAGLGKPADYRVQLESTIKLRQHGFSDCEDTPAMFLKYFKRLQQAKVLPQPGFAPIANANRPAEMEQETSPQ